MDAFFNDSLNGELDMLDAIEEVEEQEMTECLLLVGLGEYQRMYYDKKPCRTSMFRGHDFVLELINGHEMRCFDNLRMKPYLFIEFCEELKNKCGLKHSRNVTVQDQVAIFFLIVSHNERNRVVADRFQHSGETISKYFNRVVKKVCKLGVSIISPPNQNVVQPEIRREKRYFPFFKDCVGAIDETHIDARIPLADQIPYRGKKTETTQNVICACSFDMCFTFVISGWEGTSHDARIMLETDTKPEYGFPMPVRGKYYVVDSGFANMPSFLSPYRCERYHLKSFRDKQPSGREELFNYRHSSLRNVIERCFGALKGWFPILRQMPPFPVKTQKYIPVACCTIHNFIRKRMHEIIDPLFEKFEDIDIILDEDTSEIQRAPASESRIHIDITSSQLRQMTMMRDQIADSIWRSVQG